MHAIKIGKIYKDTVNMEQKGKSEVVDNEDNGTIFGPDDQLVTAGEEEMRV